jgi:hypothetical protein
MNRKAFIISALFTITYCGLCYYILTATSGIFSGVFAFPFILVLFLSYSLGDNYSYLFIILMSVIVWYIIYLVVNGIIKTGNSKK